MRFFKELFKRPITICFAIILSILVGVIATSNMNIALLPDMALPFLTVQTMYVGASAETIDEQVTSPLSNTLSNMANLEAISTYSVDNCSVLVMQFKYGTDLDEKESDIETLIKSISLPSGCEDPVVSAVDLNGTALATLTIYSETDDIKDVYKDTLELKNQLSSIEGVGNISLVGDPTQKVSIKVANGLEMMSGLIVQKIATDDKLDIPLGNIESGGSNIAINNYSKAQSVEAIKNLTMSVDLGTETNSTFTSVQTFLNNIESMNADDVLKIKNNGLIMHDDIKLIKSKSKVELEDFQPLISTISSFTSLIDNTSASLLRALWNTVLKRLVESDDFKNLDDASLQVLATNLKVEYSVLKWLQDNAKDIDPVTNTTKAEEKWETICTFKENHTDSEISNEDYATLFYDIEATSEEKISKAELIEDIDFARRVNSVYFNDVMNKLIKGEEPTNAEYAMMFIGLVSISEVTNYAVLMDFIVEEHFASNIDIIYNYKLNHQHDENGTMVGDKMPSKDYVDLYNQMDLPSNLLALKPSEKMVDFVRNSDFSSASLSFKVDDLADVAVIESFESAAYYNSNRAIQIKLYGVSGANATSIVKEVNKIIDKYSFKYSNSKVLLINDQSAFISSSINNMVVSLVIGAVLAIMVIYLFLRKVRSSLIIGISMPLSVLLTLLVLYAMGITLNMVSVGGLAVGIGMLVDNSIVVLESITSEREKNKGTALESAISGTKLVMGSLIGSTLTSICVFFPILFIAGLTREIFKDLAWSIIFSLSFSLLVAILIIPGLYCMFFKKEEKPKVKVKNNKKADKPGVMEKIKNKYGTILNKVLCKKGTLIIATFAIFIASFGLLATCNVEFLPSIDQGKIETSIKYAPGTSPEYCEQTTLEVVDKINENIENIDTISVSVGFSGLIETNRYGTLAIQLNDKAKDTKVVAEDIRELVGSLNLEEEYSVSVIDGVIASIMGGTSGVSISITGESVDALESIAKEVEKDVLTKKGIKSASDNMLSKSTSYNVSFNDEALASKGLDYSTVVQTMRIGLAGYDVRTLVVEGIETTVNVKWNDDTIGGYYATLGDYIVGTDKSGNFVKLSEVANVEEKIGRHVIRKTGGLNQVDITVEAYGIDTNTASKYLQESAKKVLKNYVGYSYQTSGISYYLTDAFKGLFIAASISFFLLYAVIACLFESLRKPTIIIMSFPFGFVGAFIALAITGTAISVVSFIGLVMLMGVVVNNAIVLLERIEQLRDGGLEIHEAIIEGCKQRVRPVLMTTLTTILALIPMALGLGDGGALMAPLGIVAFGGLLVSTLVTLFVIPATFALMYKIKFVKGKDYQVTKTEEQEIKNE